MGYALFAQRKIVLDGMLNSLELQQTQRSNEQYKLATDSLSLQQQMTSMSASQSSELSELYDLLSAADGTDERNAINATISSKQAGFDAELDEINRAIYEVSVKEQAVEMEVKCLDTKVTAIQKELEAVEEAEADAIDRATPSFNGVG